MNKETKEDLIQFNSHYDVGGQKFANIFQAFDRSIETGNFCYYNINQEWIDVIESKTVKLIPNRETFQKLILKKLISLRKKHNKLVLLYSGGTDSHTILKIALINNIFIDEIFISYPDIFNEKDSKIYNQEFFSALTFAEKHKKNIGKITIYNWKMEDYEFLDVKEWWKNSNYSYNKLKIQPYWSNYASKIYKNLDGVVITGHEKPNIKVKDGKFYWFILDPQGTEHTVIKNSYPLFLDPEVVVHYSLLLKNLLKSNQRCLKTINNEKYFFWGLKNSQIQKFYKSCGLYFNSKKSIEWVKKPSWTLQNYKNKAILQTLKENHKELYNKILEQHQKIYETYRSYNHMIYFDNKLVKPIDRYSQMFEITDNSLICRGHNI